MMHTGHKAISAAPGQSGGMIYRFDTYSFLRTDLLALAFFVIIVRFSINNCVPSWSQQVCT